MQYGCLGKSGIPLSPLGIGCWSYGGGSYWGAQSQQDVERVVRNALDKGANFFDTARMYNDGKSEESLGMALRGVREKAVICSKVSPANAYFGTLKKECERSLTALQTDYLDLYMLHWPISPYGLKHFTADENILNNPPTIEEALDALSSLKKEGKIRAIGLSNFGVRQMEQALAICSDISANEMPYNIFSRAIEAEILPFCTEHGIAVITSMSLQQGLLTGAFTDASQVPPHQAHSRHFSQQRGGENSRHGEPGAEAEIFSALPKLRSLADECGCSLAQLSIAWILARPGIQSALAGCRTLIELDSNLAACEIHLPAHVVQEIDRISQPVLDQLGNNPDYYENTKNSRIY